MESVPTPDSCSLEVVSDSNSMESTATEGEITPQDKKSFYIYDPRVRRKRRHDPFFTNHVPSSDATQKVFKTRQRKKTKMVSQIKKHVIHTQQLNHEDTIPMTV